MTIVSGGEYELNGALYALTADFVQDGSKVKFNIKLCGIEDMAVNLKSYNLENLSDSIDIKIENGAGEAYVEANIINSKLPLFCFLFQRTISKTKLK